MFNYKLISFICIFTFFSTIIAREVTLFDHVGHKGRQVNVQITQGCSNAIHHRFNDKASSINTHGHCIILCQHPDCNGRCVKVGPGNPDRICRVHNNLDDDNCDFNQRASSSKRC
uniref:Beta/gamma crystallin 'Greek key' domain-containing protein n=1 Tax=Rhabditophanes sp. KR3021 TaxID=114890 RepID=A0AC35TRS7_9BILA